jgi:WD40 repeat protein
VADIGEGAARRFVPVAGSVSADGRYVALTLRRQLPRTVASRTPPVSGPEARVAVVDVAPPALRTVVHEGGSAPTALSWGVGPLVVGLVAQVIEVEGDGGQAVIRPLPSASACRCLATTAGGRVAAGLADGQAVVWSGRDGLSAWPAHDGVVAAAAWGPDGRGLATGGADGVVRLWSDAGERRGEVRVGGAVEALAWPDDGRLVAKAGGQAGRVVVIGVSG